MPRPEAVKEPGNAGEPRREGSKAPTSDDDDAIKRREMADLAAQQSMADSAMRLLNLTFAQIIVGVLGILGLGATVYYSRQTARAAVAATTAALDSAKAANESAQAASKQVSLAERSFRDLERPYVFVDDLKYQRTASFNGQSRGVLLLTLANYGRSPAIMREIEAIISAHQVPDINDGMAFRDSCKVPNANIIPAGEKRYDVNISGSELNEYSVSRIQEGTLSLSVIIYARHGNVFDSTIREEVFALAFDYALSKFLRDENIPINSARHDEKEWQDNQKAGDL